MTALILVASAFAALSVSSSVPLSHDGRDQVLMERPTEAAESEKNSDARDTADAWLDERIETLRSKTERSQKEQKLLEHYERMQEPAHGAKLAPL
ncbi:MAG: hypothetical protein KKB75_09075 [Alphaproteobacteria bacterium]|nr:hypothetical protein [Alphaproteobacteria bacterium]